MIDSPFTRMKRYKIPTKTKCETRVDTSKKVWFIYCRDTDTGDHEAFMDKIAASIELSLASDVEVLKINADISLISLLPDEPGQIIVAFGPTPRQLGLNLSDVLYEIIKVGHHTFLFSDSLSVISSDQRAKRDLWSALKSLFLAKT